MGAQGRRLCSSRSAVFQRTLSFRIPATMVAMLRWFGFALLPLLHAMKPLSPQEIQGTWSGVMLPVIAANDTIDWLRLEAEVDALIKAKVDGIYTSGTAEELSSLSEDEFTTLNKIVAKKATEAGMAFQLGASNPSAQVMRKYVQAAKLLEPGAIQVILPDYYAVKADEAKVFLAELARLAAPVGLVLYNPGNAKRLLTPAEFGPLTQYIVGLKVVDGDRSWYSAMQKCCSNVSIAVTGHHFASGSVFGANCSYSNVAALSPCGAVKWNELIRAGVTDGGKLRQSLELEDRIGAFFQDVVVAFAGKGYSDMALDKLLAEIGGWANIGTALRWPYKGISVEDARSYRTMARERLPELFACSKDEVMHV